MSADRLLLGLAVLFFLLAVWLDGVAFGAWCLFQLLAWLLHLLEYAASRL